jgi:mRNA interferase RelE/StbE
LAARVDYKASVEKDLHKLDPPTVRRVLDRLEKALQASRNPGERLHGEFAGLFKLRVGDWRAIYTPVSDGYLILRIAHRREVYR